jgi:hypothetical protein
VNGDGLDDLIVGASAAHPSSKVNAGNSYVIFGKKDSITINLSAVASGTGGFVIIGENAGGWSGNSVSSAGDVNGDGLDDFKSSTPSPFTSPALETELPLLSPASSPLITNPPVSLPLAIAERSIVVLSFLPKMT